MNHLFNPPPARLVLKRSGFTIVELIVVISVIALLIALLLPALASAQDSGRLTTCLTNQRQTQIAMQLYLNDSKGFFRPAQYKATNLSQTNVIWESFNPGVNTGRPVGTGHLARLNYLQSVGGLYCLTNTYVNNYRDHGPVLGPSRFGVTSTAATEVFGDYALNTLMMQYPFGSTKTPTDPSDDDFRLDDNHPAFPVLADVFMQRDPGLSTLWTYYRPHKDQGIAVTYIDGSAEYQLLRRIGNVGPGFYDYGNLSTDPSSFATWLGWVRLYRMRGGK
jgi:prepilin-type N-terminal cleavage/methylation domain-containing protein